MGLVSNRRIVGWGEQGSWIVPTGSIISNSEIIWIWVWLNLKWCRGNTASTPACTTHTSTSKVCKGLCMPTLDLWINLFKGACTPWNFISVAKGWYFLRAEPFVYPVGAVGIKLRYWNSSSFSSQQRETDTSRGWGQTFLVLVSQHWQYRGSRLVS